MDIDPVGNPTFYETFLSILVDPGDTPIASAPLVELLVTEVNQATHDPRTLATNPNGSLQVLTRDQEGQLFFELIGYLPRFRFAQFGTKTVSVYSTMICPSCQTPLNENPAQNTITTQEIFQSMLYVPFPRGSTLEEIIQQEFETIHGIPYDCVDRQHCKERNIGTKSKTTILTTSNMGMVVSVTRRHHRTQQRIPTPIQLGSRIVTLHQGTPDEKQLELCGSILHSVVGTYSLKNLQNHHELSLMCC